MIKIRTAGIIHSDWLRQDVLVFDDHAKAVAELGKTGIESDRVPCGSAGAGWAEHEDGSGLFWMILPDGCNTPAPVVHECVHVADYLCEHAGIPINADCVEVRCYLTEWLFDEVMKVLAPKAKKERRKK